MSKIVSAVLLVTLAVVSSSAFCAEPVRVSPEEAKEWIAYTIPLPKAIDITHKVRVNAANVAIVPPENCDVVTRQAVSDLHNALGVDEGHVTTAPEFTIRLVLGGPDSDPLKSLKNADQAGRIFAPAGAKHELRVVAMTSKGLYYAVLTLAQLVRARTADGTAEIPIVDTTDWPDMEDRALWGADPWAYLPWLGGIKINGLEQITMPGIKEGKPYANIGAGREPLLTETLKYGIKFVPVILHLEQGKPGVFEAHPEYKAIDSPTDSFCYSQPGVVDLISEWMVQLVSLPNVQAIDQWTTENLAGERGCQCSGCKGQDRNLMEFRTVIKAWEKAKAKLGRDFGLYILSSEETEHSNVKMLAELPKDVRFWYYHSLLSYNTSEVPMVRPYVEKAAGQGQWMGICPNLCSIVHFYAPFTAPQFFKYRMKEFADKGLSGVLGFPAPLISFVKFGIEGEAEWSWNSNGRTPEEFAYSYAVRNGIRNPALFAQWTETLGPVSWDIYGSEWPSGEIRGVPEDAALRLKNGTLNGLGYVLWETYYTPWGDIKTVKQLNDNVAAAEKAVQLARKMGIKEYWYESLMTEGFIKSLKALHELNQIVKNGAIPERKMDDAKRYFDMYVRGLAQARDEFSRWEGEVDGGANRSYYKHPAGFIDSMIVQMRQVAGEMGVTVAQP